MKYLTMPCTSKKFEMHLFIPKSQAVMAYIKIMEAQSDADEKLALFFSKMRFGIKTLQPFTLDNKPLAIMPKCNLTFREELGHQRVFKHDGRVYKLYDGVKFGSPNIKIIELLGNDYLGELKVEKLTKDGQIKLLSYDYHLVKEGGAEPLTCFKQ